MNPERNLVASAKKSGDPFKTSEYFDLAERSMKRHWPYYIWPMICDFDFDLVVDLAIGHGRNTEFLRRYSKKVVGIEINQECLDACAERFRDAENVHLHKTNGASLQGIEDGSASLIYCFDAMVHFEPDVVESYVSDFARALKPGGHGFIHHSNWTGGYGQDFRTQPHWRNYMSADIFKDLVREYGLVMLKQMIIGWDESIPAARRDKNYCANLDCISVFQK